MIKKLAILFIVLISFSLFGCIAVQPQGEAQAVKIGYILPLTGDLASIGAELNNSVMLATTETNAAQAKYVFEAVIEDDACRPENTVKSYDKLVKQDGIKFIGGPACSSPILSIAPKANQDNVIIVSGSATQADITTAGDFVFRVVPSDNAQGAEGAKIANEKGYKKAAVLYVNNDYGKGLSEVFKAEFEKLGGEVLLTDSLEQDGTDFRTQITKVKGVNPEVLYMISYPKSGGVLIKQVRELGLTLPLISAEGMKDQETLDIAGKAAEGLIITSPSSNKDANYQKFAEAYKAKYGNEPGIYSSEYYDLAMLLMKSVIEAGPDANLVKAGLYATKNYGGASGKITLDENGDIVGKGFDRSVVKDGKFEAL